MSIAHGSAPRAAPGLTASTARLQLPIAISGNQSVARTEGLGRKSNFISGNQRQSAAISGLIRVALSGSHPREVGARCERAAERRSESQCCDARDDASCDARDDASCDEAAEAREAAEAAEAMEAAEVERAPRVASSSRGSGAVPGAV